MLVLSKKVLYAIENTSYEGAHIVGKKGIGKTVYALIVAWEVFCNLGYDENEAWRMALDRLLFSKKEIINYLMAHSGKPDAIVIFDDIRVFMSGMSYHDNPKETQLLLGLLDTVRTSVSAVITTSPTLIGVLGFIKKDEDYLIRIVKANAVRQRRATGYARYTLPSGTPRVRKTFIDDYACRLPDKVYREAYKKRMTYKNTIVKKLKEKADEYVRTK